MQRLVSLVDVDILELSESPWPGIDIFCANMGLERQIVKELDLKGNHNYADKEPLKYAESEALKYFEFDPLSSAELYSSKY